MESTQKQKSIKKNYIYNSTYLIISFLVQLCTAPYVSRILHDDGVGISSVVVANVSYFTLFGMLGIAGYAQREGAILRDDKKKLSVFFWELQLLHTIMLTLALVPYVFLILNAKKFGLYYVISLVTIAASLFDISWMLQLNERFDTIAIRNITVQVMLFIATFTLIKDKSDLPIYVGLTGTATLISNVSMWFEVRKLLTKVKLSELKPFRHMKDVLIFFVPSIAASIYSYFDKTLISLITESDKENGYYEQAYKIYLIAASVVQSLSTVSVPRMAHIFAHGTKKEFNDRLNASLRFMVFIAVPSAFGMAGIAYRFVPFYFGEMFRPVTRIIYVFAPILLISGFNVYLDGMYLTAIGQKMKGAVTVCIGSVVNLILNVLFISLFSAIGAALATLISESLICVAMFYHARASLEGKSIVKWLLKYGTAGILMFGIVFYTGTVISNSWICIIVQFMAGFISYSVVLLIEKDDLYIDIMKAVLISLRIMKPEIKDK